MARMPARSGVLARLASRGSRVEGREAPHAAIYAHSPRLLFAAGVFDSALERSGALDPKLKHLAILRTAALAGCRMCVDAASFKADGKGISERQVLELGRYGESDAFDDLERLVLDLATGMSATPAEVSDELFARLLSRLSPAAMLELVTTVAFENHRARWNVAMGIESLGLTEGAACALVGA